MNAEHPSDEQATTPPPHPGANKDYLGDQPPAHIPKFDPNGLPEGEEAPKQHGESPTGKRLQQELAATYKSGTHLPGGNEDGNQSSDEQNFLDQLNRVYNQ